MIADPIVCKGECECVTGRVDAQLNDTESHIVVAGQPFGLVASCIHCPNVTYTWWTNTTATATSNATGPIYRNGYSLTAGETYTFTVESKSRICPQQIYSATFLLHTENSRVGHCIAIPTEGREYATLFAVHCSGFVGEAASINYRYFVKNSSTHYKGATLYESPKSSMPPQHLFAGAELDNYKRIIYIKVVDRNTWIGTANVSIVVRPTDYVIEDMVDHVSSYMFNDTGDSVLDVLLASKDFQDIANALNRVFSDTTYTTKAAEKLHKVRRMMISKLSNISDSDTGIVLDKAKCLNVITDTDYVEIEAQVEALVVYEDLGKYLKQMAYGKASLTIAGGVSKISQTSNTTAGLDTIEKPSKVVIDGVMKLMNRSTVVPLTDIEVDYSEDSFDSDWTNTDDEEKAAKRTIVRKAMTVAEYVSSALLRSVKPDSDNIAMQTGTLNQVLKKDTAARLSQQLVKFPRSDGVAISFKLPTLENVTSAADVMGLQVFKLSRNPYMWHSSAKQVNSDVVGLSIYREDGQTVRLKNLTQPVVISIPRKLVTIGEGRGVVSLFGRMSDKRPRCQLHIGLLPTFYDSSRCKLCEAKSKTCGFCNWETVVKTTSRTQIDSSKKTTDTFLNIATTVYTNDCLYWDENAEIWSNEGCKVSLNSSAAVIVCECRHLSVFSASMFVQPNSLDQFHMSLFLGIFNNPVVVALVIGAWCIYALLMMWARRKDHEDLKKQGVIFISTAVDAEYYYLITVMTGWQRDAGTSATVAMYMIGSLGVSETLVMADPTRFIHDSGAECWFLVATTANLGRLLYLRVWHNCSGIFPSWFLKQITVRNIQTNQVWDFVCDDWLTPEFGVDGIKKSLFANENKRSRVYDFRLTSMQILRSEHPWISIFSRPVYKTFNCAQRLSCVMSFAMIAMLTNIMFYGKPPVDIEEGALGGIAITKEQLIVGIESFFICLPTSIIIVAIFTNIRPREKDNLCIEFDVLETRKSFWQTKDSIKKKDESVSKQEEFDDDLLITLRQIKPRMTPRVVSTGSLLATSATVSKFDIPISQVSNIEGDKIHEAAEKAKGCLPWWFIYIAYTVTLGTGIVSSFVTIMYSLTYGYARSVAFTVSFLSTFFQDTGIFEPMKITAAAAFVTFVTGARARPNVPDSYTLNRGMDEAFFSVDTNVVRRRSSSTSSHYLFPTDWTVRMAASVVINGHKLWKLLSDFSLSILLALLLTTILNYWTPASSYNVHKSLVDTFVRVRHAGNLTFTEVRTTDEMWRYIEHSFLPSLLLSTPHYVADDTNFVVGIARIRQLRVRAGPCSNSYGTRRSLRHSCFTPYSFGAEDKSSYSPSWHSIVRKNTNVIHQSPWTYRSADETSTTSTWGRYQTFSGGGYIIPVWSMRSSKMIVSLEKLRNASWVDEKTRAVFLEFTVFNPAANLFASTVLVFEFSDMGTIDPSYYDIAVYKLHMLALFGSYCNGYKDFAKAVMHVASLFRYSDVCSMNECIHDSPYVSFLFFGFVAFFVVSMCRLQVLMCGITARCATRMSQQEKDDLQFVDYFMSRLLIHIGYWNMDDYVAHVTSQQQWRENNHPGFGQGAALSGTNLRPSPPTSRMEDPTLRPPPPTPCLEDPTVRPPPPTPRLEDPTLRPPPHNDPPTLRPPPPSDSASSRESAHHAGESLRL
ncbi:Polycystic kidney disease protein 1-like 3 [Lamellibrachia satsuma]|nr:Polycystic kidney disease protein 1-like 3 [Lamellibrachia satsuma]